VVDDLESAQERQVKALCDVLNAHDVSYLVFGSYAARLQGVPLRTLDVDVVPEASAANLQKLCDAINSLQPRWRVDDVSDGLRIDGDKLEPRHIVGSSIAIGLVTTAGRIDVLLEPKGFERGFQDLIGSAITINVDGTEITVGALKDLIVSKQMLGREKDREHLPLLLVREAEIAREQGPERGIDSGFDIGF
jgi:hypothetical protein